MLGLERAWAQWVGNPAKVKGYRSDIYESRGKDISTSPKPISEPLIPGLDDPEESSNGIPTSASETASQSDTDTGDNDQDNGVDGDNNVDPEIPRSHHHIHTTRKRPTIRPSWFGKRIDAIEYWENGFLEADELVRGLRQKGRFEATHVAFVTFEDVKDAVRLSSAGVQSSLVIVGMFGCLPSESLFRIDELDQADTRNRKWHVKSYITPNTLRSSLS